VLVEEGGSAGVVVEELAGKDAQQQAVVVGQQVGDQLQDKVLALDVVAGGQFVRVAVTLRIVLPGLEA
jgi:hypothetical protein